MSVCIRRIWQTALGRSTTGGLSITNFIIYLAVLLVTVCRAYLQNFNRFTYSTVNDRKTLQIFTQHKHKQKSIVNFKERHLKKTKAVI